MTVINPADTEGDCVHFYRRIQATMIAKRIEGLFDQAPINTFFNKKRDFTWTDTATGIEELDGPTMLQIIVQGINPTNRVGVSDYKMEIQNATLPKHSNNVQEMMDFVEANYEEILCHGFTHPDYVMHLFNALITAKNDISRLMIQQEKDKWELGKDVQPNSLVQKSTTKYNNMVLQKLWNQTNPKDANILVLTTKLENLELTYSTANLGIPTNNPGKSNPWEPEDWQITNTGPKIEKCGKTLYWCPHHKGNKNQWESMYINHEPTDHPQWEARKIERKAREKARKATTAAAKGVSVRTSILNSFGKNEGCIGN